MDIHSMCPCAWPTVHPLCIHVTAQFTIFRLKHNTSAEQLTKWWRAANRWLCWLAAGGGDEVTVLIREEVRVKVERNHTASVCCVCVQHCCGTGNKCWVQWAAHHVQHLILTLTAHQLTYIPLITHRLPHDCIHSNIPYTNTCTEKTETSKYCHCETNS